MPGNGGAEVRRRGFRKWAAHSDADSAGLRRVGFKITELTDSLPLEVSLISSKERKGFQTKMDGLIKGNERVARQDPYCEPLIIIL